MVVLTGTEAAKDSGLPPAARPKSERRTSARIKETLPVKLKGKRVEAHLFSLDIGLGGIRIFWGWPLAVGREYDLSIALAPLKSWVRVKAQVLWQIRTGRQFEIALKFAEVSRADRIKLERYFAQRCEEAGFQGEKRNDPRINVRLPVVVWPLNGRNRKASHGVIEDISLSGARFVCNSLFWSGEEISLQIQLKDRQIVLLQLAGDVVRSDRVEAFKRWKPDLVFLHAVKFRPYSSEVKRILQDYLDCKNASKELRLVENLLAV